MYLCIVFIYVCMYVCMCITEGVVISPMSGVLKGNESVTLMIAFSPVKVSLVTMYVCMYICMYETVCIYNVSHNLLFQSELHEYKLTFSTYPVGGKRICMYYVCVTYLSMCFFKCECVYVCMYVCILRSYQESDWCKPARAGGSAGTPAEFQCQNRRTRR